MQHYLYFSMEEIFAWIAAKIRIMTIVKIRHREKKLQKKKNSNRLVRGIRDTNRAIDFSVRRILYARLADGCLQNWIPFAFCRGKLIRVMQTRKTQIKGGKKLQNGSLFGDTWRACLRKKSTPRIFTIRLCDTHFYSISFFLFFLISVRKTIREIFSCV